MKSFQAHLATISERTVTEHSSPKNAKEDIHEKPIRYQVPAKLGSKVKTLKGKCLDHFKF